MRNDEVRRFAAVDAKEKDEEVVDPGGEFVGVENGSCTNISKRLCFDSKMRSLVVATKPPCSFSTQSMSLMLIQKMGEGPSSNRDLLVRDRASGVARREVMYTIISFVQFALREPTKLAGLLHWWRCIKKNTLL